MILTDRARRRRPYRSRRAEARGNTRLSTLLDFQITPQPDDTTCGPACLHAVYRYYGDSISFGQVIREVRLSSGGGTLAVLLGLHALSRGYRATIYTCNLQMFDPSWFRPGASRLRERLIAQAAAKPDPRLAESTSAYLDFLDRGGVVRMEDITAELIARLLERNVPIITGLSATWLYRAKRERPADSAPDDIAGESVGHFVVVHGLDRQSHNASVADPYLNEPYPARRRYKVNVDHLIGAIALGIVTFDAKLLVIRAPRTGARSRHADSDRGQ